MEQSGQKDTINRIRQMEFYFDTIQNAVREDAVSARNDASIQEMFRILMEYYENGQWLADYECDERGELPVDLKRGVLSEDGVYDLIGELHW
ncbi:MAG: DUF4298 domain-containing protein [Lachnospiraceae bacterium]|nr:DUF4298 domain-containing protein [Lachnospiraceae bacterium]